MRHDLCRLVVLAAGLTLTACGPTLVHVPYQMSGTPAPLAGAAAQIVGIVGVDGRHGIDAGVIGVQPSGVLTAGNDPIGTVAEGFRRELAARGYSIGAGHVQISVEITDFTADFLQSDQPFQGSPASSAGSAIGTVAGVVVVRDRSGAPMFADYQQAHAMQPFYFNTSNAPDATAVLTVAMRRFVTGIVGESAFQAAVAGGQ